MDKKMWHEEDDQIPALIKRDIEDFQEYDLANFQIKHVSNGEIAKDRFDLGRNCPQCAGRLVVKEVRTDSENNEYIYLGCKSCGIEVFADDIEATSESADQLYRQIPLSLMLRYKRN